MKTLIIIIVLWCIVDLLSYAIARLKMRERCTGTKYVNGCGKWMYPHKFWNFVLKFPFGFKYQKNYKRVIKWENNYPFAFHCCSECYDKHEAVRVAYDLTAD